jgi:hypothetical protein
MSIVTTPKRPKAKKRLLKLLKHFLQNDESFHQVTAKRLTGFGVVEWNAIQRKILSITTRSLGNWSDEEVEEIIDALYTDEHQALREELLAVFEERFRPVIDQVINEAIQDSGPIVLDAESRLYYSDYCFEEVTENKQGPGLTRADAYISRDGVIVFLKPTDSRPSLLDNDRVIRTSHRAADKFFEEKYFLREKAVHSYKQRSLFLLHQASTAGVV